MPLKTTAGNHGAAAKGRGATINPEGRFEKVDREASDDGWFQEFPEDSRPKTIIAIERAKSVISRNSSPDIGFSQSINPYRGCEHGCTYCSAGDTPILMGNGRLLPLSQVRTGDEIYGTILGGKYRRFIKTKVLAHWSSIKPAYRTLLEDGTELVTSGDHRLLTNRGWKYVADARRPEQRPHLTLSNKLQGTGRFAEGPVEDDDYRRGYLCGMLRGDAHLGARVVRLALCDAEALLRSQDYLLDFGIPTQERVFQAASGNRRAMNAVTASSIWKVEAINDLIRWPTVESLGWAKGFLAGIFDAEGSYSQTVLRISNTNPEIIHHIRQCFISLGFAFASEHIAHVKKRPIDVIRMRGGLREHLRFFHTVRPAITRKLDLVGQAIKGDAKLRVVKVERLGYTMRLYDITTGTEDFIANGVVSHNCFARPSHAYLGLSPGMDFETRISAKTNAPELLREEISKPGYKCSTLVIGVNTDAYQPAEREHRITRGILEVCSEAHHPVSLITKSALIERDIDLLAPMAAEGLASVTMSVTTLDHDISRYMEPRTSAPARRLLAVSRLAKAGIPVNVNIAPVIPFLTDHELEPILEAAALAGAHSAYYNLVRLPWEVKDIFRAWLEANFPLKAAHVMSRIHEMREGKDNDPNFGTRMTGTGLFAQLLRQRYEKAAKRFGLDHREGFDLRTDLFRPPGPKNQGSLF